MTNRAKNGGSFSEHIKLTTVDIWVVYFSYTLTDTDTCMYICILTANYTIKPVLKTTQKKDQLSLNAGQKYCRMLQGEHSAILSICNIFNLH